MTRQNIMQQMRRGQFFPIVQALVDTPATVEDYQKLAGIVQDALEQNLPPEQIEAKIRENTPFAVVAKYLKNNHLTIISIVLTIVLYILNQQQLAKHQQDPTKVEIVKPDINEMLKELEKHIDENRPAPPAPTDTSHHEEPPGTSCS